jgi:hypothetical protein
MTPGSYKNRDLTWKGNRLVVNGGGRSAPSAEIIPDANYLGMFRVKCPDGSVTDMVNRARAREAARSILLGVLNPSIGRAGDALGARPMRFADGVAA